MSAKVFISYRHVQPDETLATDIAAFLESKNFDVFIDHKILTGQKWVLEIDRQIRTSQYFVALLSAESIRSDMVRREIELAYQLEKKGDLRILPVRLGYDGELPYDLAAYLGAIQYAVWTKETPFDILCANILKGIQAPKPAAAVPETDPSPEGLKLLNQATNQKGAPLPSADPRLETGAVKLDSPYYIRRPADEVAEKLVTHAGETILVKGARQVGKTSLLARARAHANNRSLQTFYIDFQLIDESRFANLNTLLQYLAARIAKDLRTKLKPADVWDDMLGATDSLTDFIEQALLNDAPGQVVFAFDEVDNVFQHKEYRNNFFAMVRAWHNQRAMRPVWNRLNLLIGHSTEPALFIDDINQSPFNVGETIRLSDFTAPEMERLNQINGFPFQAGELADLMSLLGGQPYLTQQAFYCRRTTIKSLPALHRVAAEDDGPFGDHLRRLLWNLQRTDKMRAAVKQILRDRGCDNEPDFQRLRAAGLISGDSRESARIRCDLYRQYFVRHL